MKRIKLSDRILPKYTKGEEIFNMTTHIVGGAMGIVALVLCIIFAAIHHNGYGVVASSIYGTTMILLYTMSSVYHGLKPNTTAKKVFQILDHCSIFLLIAGSYTPFALCTLREIDMKLRLVDFWYYLGNCNFRNCTLFIRFKKIFSFFYDMLFFYGLDNYF